MTQDEPFYIPVLIKKFTDRVNHPLEIFILSGVPHGFNQVTYIKRLFDLFGIIAFIRFGSLFFHRFVLRVTSRISGKGGYSLKAIATEKKIPLFKVDKVNDPSVVEKIKSFHPDVIISIASPQIFREELILCADHVINIHAALLPKYRGMMPNFWVLAKGEKKTGVTVHYIDSKIDTGPILLQKEIIIDQNESFHSLNTKVAETSADILVEVIQNIGEGKISTIIPESLGSYFSFPTKETAKELRSRGRKII